MSNKRQYHQIYADRSDFSIEEAKKIQEKLNLKLGPEFVSYRPAPGGSCFLLTAARVAYVEGWAMFNMANDIFGFNGWSSSIIDTVVDFIDDQEGRISLGISCTVRVILKDGSFHEDIGYGTSENQRSKAAAYEKAKKEAVTDGVKRALRYFGNSLGNCTYDKSFLKNIKTMSIPQRPPLEADQLIRQGRTGLQRSSPPEVYQAADSIEVKLEPISDPDFYPENEDALNNLFDEANNTTSHETPRNTDKPFHLFQSNTNRPNNMQFNKQAYSSHTSSSSLIKQIPNIATSRPITATKK